MIDIVKTIFSNYKYLVLAVVIFTFMLFVLLIISEYLFLEPYLIGHIPQGTELGFGLIIVLSGLSALVIPMNVYRISILKSSKGKISGGIFGSFIGAISGACSCGPIGFAVISTFGTFGATVSAFLTNFETPVRIGSILLLVLTCYTTIKSLKIECKIR